MARVGSRKIARKACTVKARLLKYRHLANIVQYRPAL